MLRPIRPNPLIPTFTAIASSGLAAGAQCAKAGYKRRILMYDHPGTKPDSHVRSL